MGARLVIASVILRLGIGTQTEFREWPDPNPAYYHDENAANQRQSFTQEPFILLMTSTAMVRMKKDHA